MRRVFEGRGGMVLAFVAGLVVASAGSAAAASLITGSRIKDGTVSARDLSPAVQAQLRTHAARGLRGLTGARGAAGAAGTPGAPGVKGDPGPSTGPAGGDLAGSYPNPTLRPAANVQIGGPALSSNACPTTFDTFCGDVGTGSYWAQPGSGFSYLGYYVERSGFIQFQGTALQVGAGNAFLFVLPPGRRPSANLRFPVVARDGDPTADEYVIVRADGQVGLLFTIAGGTYDMSGVRFQIGG